MPQILVVEGLTDATFFQELFSGLYLRDAEVEYDRFPGRRNIPKVVRGMRPDGSLLEVEFRNEEGKGNVSDTVGGLLRRGVREFAVAQDIDNGTPDQLVQSIRQMVYSHLRLAPPTGPIIGRRLEIGGGAITVIPMGMYGDAALETLGITSHAVEDHLIKLLLADAGLRQRAPELQGLLSEILPTIRRHDGDFNSSKELFQLIKPVVQHGFSDTGVVQSLFANADPDILQSVLAPVLADVEQAVMAQ
jgi:hypothetical protein